MTGVLVEDPVMVQTRDFDTDKPEFWDDGSPKMQPVVRIQTDLREDDDDDGVRVIYCKGGKMTGPKGGRTLQEAIRHASIEAKAPVRKGGTLTVRYLEQGEPAKRGFNGPKLYVAKYTPPSAPDPFADPAPAKPGLDDF